MTGVLGDAALAGPDELAIYVGYQPSSLAAVPGTQLVTTLQGTPGPAVFTPFFRYAFAVGVLAVLFPILILIGTATRLAAARREERFAALRLVGATPRDINVIASVDSVVSTFFGAIVGIGLFLAIRPALAGAELTGTRYFAATVSPLRLGVPRHARRGAGRVGARGAGRAAPGADLAARRQPPGRPAAAVGVAAGHAGRRRGAVRGGAARDHHKSIGSPAYPGLLIVMIGIVIAGPWLTVAAARWCARVFNGASPLLATRRLADNPKAAFRAVRGLVLAVFLGTIVGVLVPAVETFSATPNASALNNVLLDTFDNTQSTAPGPVPCSTLPASQRHRIGLRRHGRRGRGGAGRAHPAGRREAGQRAGGHRRDGGLPPLPPAAGGRA